MLKKIWCILFSLLILKSPLSFAGLPVSGIDHAPRSEAHLDSLEKFMEKSFLKDGYFNKSKIKNFIERLKKEKEKLMVDLAETKIIEDVELYVVKPEKAIKKRRDPKDLENEPLVIGYNYYLIPKMEQLLKLVEEGASYEDCIAIVCDFVRGYASYYAPNSKRTIFPFDTDIPRAIKHIFKSFSFKKESKKVEAINLRVDLENQREVESYLLRPVIGGEYLKEEDIKKLKESGFDISKLNPGVSALWKQVDKEAQEKEKKEYKKYYPSEKDKIYFKKLIYRGMGSPKLKVYFKKEDKKIELKLKLGQEVHTDLAASALMRTLGFNQDHMEYQKSVKVYLGDTTYNEFMSQFASKYSVENANRFIWGHGKTEKGEDWVLIKDCLFEIRPEDELRGANMNFTLWDLQDRREYRALLLAWGWLGVNDTKYENFKFLLKKQEDGSYIPLYRLQDTGVGLGTQCFVDNPNDIIKLINYYKVNDFPTSFVKWDLEKEEVKIRWNDFALAPEMFKRTTWDDLKWMARLMLKVDKEDIRKALSEGGMPSLVRDLYYYKLLMRRNDLIKAFHLESEFQADYVPDLKKYNLRGAKGEVLVKKGKIIKKSFEGKNDVIQVGETWLTFIPEVLRNLSLSGDFFKYEHGHTTLRFNTGDDDQGLAVGKQLDQFTKEGGFYKLPIGVGIQAFVTRIVRPSKQYITLNGQTHQYMIKDILKFRFYGSSPLFNKVVSSVKGLSFNFDLNFFEKEFTHIHFAETDIKAYKKKFEVFKVLGGLKKFVAHKLEPMDILKTHLNYGVDANFDMSTTAGSFVLENSVDLGFAVKRYLTNHYTRDQYGQLTVLKEVNDKQEFNFALKLFEINTYEAKLPLFRIGAEAGHFHMKFDSHFVPRDKTTREGTHEYLSKERRKKDEEILKKGTIHNPDFVNNYHLETKGHYSNYSLGALFLFNREGGRSHALTKVTDGDQNKKTFYRYALFKENSTGVKDLTLDFGTTEILVDNRKRMEVIAEADLTNLSKDKVYYNINVEDYYRVKEREKLGALLRDLNRRYSESSELKFYRDYEIPETMESNKFRKIYAFTRVHISGKHLHRKFKKLTKSDLKKKLIDHFASIPGKDRFKVRMLKHHIVSLHKKIAKKDPHKQEDQMKIIEYVTKALYYLRAERYGLGFLRDLLKKKALLVMGDISGIQRNYSMLQSLQQQQKRRFAGVTWGTLKKKLPLQNFMRSHRYVPTSGYIERDLEGSKYFGELKTSLGQKNIRDIYDKNNEF